MYLYMNMLLRVKKNKYDFFYYFLVLHVAVIALLTDGTAMVGKVTSFVNG